MITNDKAAKLLYVSHNQSLLKKIENGNRSIFIFDSVDEGEVNWHEEVIYAKYSIEGDDDSNEDMLLARLITEVWLFFFVTNDIIPYIFSYLTFYLFSCILRSIFWVIYFSLNHYF